ncbi:HPP family protein [Burkholderia oklahomensis]|uniref:HPP family protein n=1 Tax=Burkholderia oklahomensis TaxID=342113 RepID=UPI002650B090|nr:HPP family protein [Burkholderia oklahomensis]MDN7671165.1 HPP family protein [Burkholderia oklahomensis]
MSSSLVFRHRLAHRLVHWLLRFVPIPVTLGWRERLRSCAGALAGIGCVGVTMRVLPGVPGDVPLLVAPMGASAVLLFAVPASPLAQPWSLIGGNLVAATVGVACAQWIADPVLAASLAIACAIGAMFALRCVHPPSGAVALTAVVGGPAVHALGFRFVVEPIALQSAALLGAALVYHALAGHRYPHGGARPQTESKTDAAVTPLHARFVRADLEAALKSRSEWLDVAPEDLESLLRETELRAYARTFDELSCADIMTRPAISIAPDTPLPAAMTLLDRHRIKALPVVDANARVVGIVTRADLSRAAPYATPGLLRSLSARLPRSLVGPAFVARAVMSARVHTVRTTTPIAELVPLFADHGHHHIPVVDADQRLAGIVTQADLIAGLYRQSQMRLAA